MRKTGCGMEFEQGRVVIAAAGRGAGRFYAVIAQEGGSLLLADGKKRPLEKPKRKNRKHVRKTNTRLDSDCLDTNKKLRRALSALSSGEGGEPLG